MVGDCIAQECRIQGIDDFIVVNPLLGLVAFPWPGNRIDRALLWCVAMSEPAK